jgi:F0F1-type ATP synthase assembly protein I
MRMRDHLTDMSLGVTIVVGAVIGLALGILISVTTDVPLAPEAGLLLGAVVGWLSRRNSAQQKSQAGS